MRAVSGGIRGEYPLSTTEVGEEVGEVGIEKGRGVVIVTGLRLM